MKFPHMAQHLEHKAKSITLFIYLFLFFCKSIALFLNTLNFYSSSRKVKKFVATCVSTSIFEVNYGITIFL
jgi:hypothetical protein